MDPYRALVTGGAGFIGSTLVDRLLAEGHTVDVVDNLSTGSLGNLAEARAVRDRALQFPSARRPFSGSGRADGAAQARGRVSPRSPGRCQGLGGRPGFRRGHQHPGVAASARGGQAAGARKVVFASSGGTIYGDAEQLPIKESQAQRPLSPYGVAKKAVGDYLYVYRELHGLEFTALALANVYGPRQDLQGEAGVVAIFAGRLLSGEPCLIFGDGKQTRDFVYVDDVVDAFSRAGERGSGLLCNIGTGRRDERQRPLRRHGPQRRGQTAPDLRPGPRRASCNAVRSTRAERLSTSGGSPGRPSKKGRPQCSTGPSSRPPRG